MNTNENTNGAEINTAATEYHKRDYSRLPKVRAASIHIDGNVRNGAELKVNAYIVNVCLAEDWTDVHGNVHKAGEWRNSNEIMHLAGLKTAARAFLDTKKNGVVVTKAIDKARAEKANILAKWGSEKKAAKPKKSVADRVAAMSPEQKAEYLAELMKAA